MTKMRRPVSAILGAFLAVAAAVATAPAGAQTTTVIDSLNRVTRLPDPGREQLGLLSGGPGVAPLRASLAAYRLHPGNGVYIRIFKEERQLEVWIADGARYRRFWTYPVCDFSGRLGPKLAQGDKQAPEGFYAITFDALNPNSSFHLSFNLGFPNAYDRANGRTGSALMVHGGCISSGCYAMTDSGITEIYAIVEAALLSGQPSVPVHIFPFRMTDARMRRALNDRRAGEWLTLKVGYDRFEAEVRPPEVFVCDRSYVFRPGPGCTGVNGAAPAGDLTASAD